MPKISDIILKGRFLILILFIGIIALMIQSAKDVKLSYEVAKILPSDDQTYIDYENFKSEIGESMNTIVIAVNDARFFEKHITLDRNLPGPDHPFALDSNQMKTYVNGIRCISS